MMFCHKCGRELNDNVSRCPFCNADTSAYLEDDDSSLREILRLSEELNDDSEPSLQTSQSGSGDAEGKTSESEVFETYSYPDEENSAQDESGKVSNQETGEQNGFTDEEQKSDFQEEFSGEVSKNDSEPVQQETVDSDGFYIPKMAAIKAGILPKEEEETEEFSDTGENQEPEYVEYAQDNEDDKAEQENFEEAEIETIDAEEEPEEPEEEEYYDETDEFISNYIPINEIPEEPEEYEYNDEDIDYEDGFVDSGYQQQDNYKEEPQDNSYYEEYYEEEAYQEKPRKKGGKKKFIIIPIILVVIAAAGWFVLSETVINSSANEAINAFADKKYDTAARIYNESVKNSPIQMWLFNGKMNGYIDDVIEDHRDKVITFDEAKIALNSVIALDDERFTQKAKEALETIEALEESRAAYAAGQKYFSNGDYIAAAKEFDKVIESDPDYSKAVASRDRSYEKYKEQVLAQTSGCDTVEEYKAAIEILNEAVKNLPNDTEIKSRLDNCTKGLEEAVVSETVDTVNSYMDAGDYREALDIIEETLEEYPENATLLNLKTSCTDSYISFATSQAQQLLNSEEYMEAIELMDSMLQQFPDNETLISSRDECVSVYVNAAVSSADEFMNAGNYETALEVIEKALKDLPDNSTLLDKKDEIETNMPVSLMDECPPHSGTNLKTFTNSSTSSFKIDGKTYREGFTLYSSTGWFSSGNGVAQMNINGLYSRLTFNAGKVDGGKSVNGVLKVYVDNQLVDTIRIDSGSGLQSFEIALNYGSTLKFELSAESGTSTPTYGFTNLALYK